MGGAWVALGARIPLPVLWVLVCSTVIPRSPWRVWDPRGGGGRTFCHAAKCCVSACLLVGVVMLLVLLEICICEASSCGCSLCCNYVFYILVILVVVYLSSTCLTINCLHFLFKYAFFPFILVFTLDCFNLWFVFGLFYLCLVTHLLTKHAEISTLCARYSLQ